MRRGGGVIPPGRAGLIVLAVAMVPIAIKKFPKAVKWFGRQLENAGTRVQKTVDEVDRYDRERQANGTTRSTVTSTSAKRPHDATNGVKQTMAKEEKAPETETASPHGHVEVEAQKTRAPKTTSKPTAKAATKPKPTPKPKIQGAAPPANDPKRSRKKSEGQQ
ncbi:MAG TPA: hypothetical protein VGL56_00375 [Fimbriimonadaceae bacterium]